MKQVLHIIYYKILAFFVVSFDKKPKTVLKNLATMLVYLAFAVGMYKIAFATLYSLMTVIKLNSFLFHRFVAIILFIFFISVNAGNILVSLTGLFRSREIDYLFTKPIKQENIFIIKFFDNFFYSSGTLFMILFAVLLSYGNYFKLGISFYILSVFGLFIPFTLIAGILGVLFLFLLIHLAKKISIQLTVVLLAALYISSVIIFFVYNDPPQIIQNALLSESYVKGLFEHLDNPLLKLLPNYWVSNSLYWFQKGEPLMGAQYIILLYAEASVLLIGAYLMAQKLYYKTFVMASELKLKKGDKPENSISLLRFDNKRRGSPVFWSVFRKEGNLFMRDPSQIIHLLFMVILMAIFIISIGGRPVEIFKSLNPDVQSLIYLVFFLFNSFFISSLALRFVFPHYSLEGEPFWKMRSAPVNMKKIFRYKFIFFFVIILFLSEMLSVFSHIRFSNSLKLFSSIITFFITLTVVSVNFGFGTYFVNFAEKNPIRISSSQGASTAFLVCLLYLGFIIGILFLPLHEYFIRTQNLKQIVSFSFFSLPLIMIGSISTLITLLSYYLCMRETMKDI